MKVPWRGKTIRNAQLARIIQKTITSFGIATVLLSSGGAVYADSFDDQINALSAQATAQQAQASALHNQANDYRSKVAELQAQSAAIATQISINQAKSRKLNNDIQDAQAKLAQQKEVLGDIVKTMYFDSTVSPLEMLASSSNISDFLDNEQYHESIKAKIQTAMTEIETLRKSLEKQQADLDHILADQKGQQQQLAINQAEANQLLATAQQSATTADQQVKDANSKINQLRAQQAAAIAAASHHISGGTSAGCGGYPSVWCNAAQDSLVDSWGMYNRECVSYAAWRVSASGKYMPYWGGRGDAKQWPGNARAAGIPVDGTPKVGDVAIYMGGTYGHAMVVEQIKSSSVIVSSFNADNTGHYSVDEWPTSSLYFLHFH